MEVTRVLAVHILEAAVLGQPQEQMAGAIGILHGDDHLGHVVGTAPDEAVPGGVIVQHLGRQREVHHGRVGVNPDPKAVPRLDVSAAGQLLRRQSLRSVALKFPVLRVPDRVLVFHPRIGGLDGLPIESPLIGILQGFPPSVHALRRGRSG